MQIKLVEIRDEGTCIPAMAIKLSWPENEAEAWLLDRAGYDKEETQAGNYVLLGKIAGSHPQFQLDPYDWLSSRTMHTAHLWIINHFDEMEPGQVVDVRYILGETSEPCISDRFYGAS